MTGKQDKDDKDWRPPVRDQASVVDFQDAVIGASLFIRGHLLVKLNARFTPLAGEIA